MCTSAAARAACGRRSGYACRGTRCVRSQRRNSRSGNRSSRSK